MAKLKLKEAIYQMKMGYLVTITKINEDHAIGEFEGEDGDGYLHIITSEWNLDGTHPFNPQAKLRKVKMFCQDRKYYSHGS
jgi:hypothetical protein